MSTYGLQTIAVIPARGGSKSIPKKNIVPLGGRPLLAWSIQTALAVPGIDKIIVSTDSDDIAAVADAYKVAVSRRPPELATDTALVIDTLRDLLRRLAQAGEAPKSLVLLEPTCPFRLPQDIEQCLSLLEDDTLDSVATFKRAELNPYRAWKIEEGRAEVFMPGVNPWLPRQQLPPAYQLNGAVYAFRCDRLRPEHPSILFGRTAAVIMPPERSIDIDNPIDLKVAQAILDSRAVP